MSTVLHRRELHVAITAEESANELMRSSADIQAVFFLMLAREVKTWRYGEGWPMQCRFIADEMDNGQRAEVVTALDTLIEHLREVRKPNGITNITIQTEGIERAN